MSINAFINKTCDDKIKLLGHPDQSRKKHLEVKKMARQRISL